jgi:ATP-dependent RNA helicase DOB1
MLLNLMRVEGVKPEMLINSSFAAFQAHRRVPELESSVESLRAEVAVHSAALEAAGAAEAAAARELVQIRGKLEVLRGEWEAVVLHPVHAMPFLQPGRLARVSSSNAWGVLVACQRLAGDKGAREDCVLELLLPLEREWTVQSVRLSEVSALSSLRMPLPPDLRGAESRTGVGRKLEAVAKRFAPHGPPLLDPVEDMNIRDNAALERCAGRIAQLELLLLEPRFAPAAVAPLFGHAAEEAVLKTRLAAQEQALKESRHAYLAPDLKCMRRVLRRLAFTTETDVIDVKV